VDERVGVLGLEKIEGWSVREVLGGGAEGEGQEEDGEYEGPGEGEGEGDKEDVSDTEQEEWEVPGQGRVQGDELVGVREMKALRVGADNEGDAAELRPSSRHGTGSHSGRSRADAGVGATAVADEEVHEGMAALKAVGVTQGECFWRLHSTVSQGASHPSLISIAIVAQQPCIHINHSYVY
jgi:hypothetical protein